MKTPTEKITLVGATESVELSPTTLLVAVDDTGHESFAPTHRVFGIGGCACLVGHYHELIDAPWRGMKGELFGGPNTRLHAAALRNPTEAQLEGLNCFFTHFNFARFAVMAADSLEQQTSHSLLKVTSRSLLDRVAAIARYAHPTDVAIVIEQSQRTGADLAFELGSYRMGNGETDFQPRTFLLPKSAGSSMLEVADFVMHAAGGQVRNRLARKFTTRKDFEAVFYKVDRRLSEYIELLSVKDAA